MERTIEKERECGRQRDREGSTLFLLGVRRRNGNWSFVQAAVETDSNKLKFISNSICHFLTAP